MGWGREMSVWYEERKGNLGTNRDPERPDDGGLSALRGLMAAKPIYF